MVSQSNLLRNVGLTVLVIWALLFLGGAMGAIFEIEFLRRLTDIKSIFLR